MSCVKNMLPSLSVSPSPDDFASPKGPLFFFFSFLVKMCLIFRFVEFEIQWYVAGLLKWNELDGKKQLFSIYKYLKQQNDQINVALGSFELPSRIFSTQVFEDWAPLVKVYLLFSLLCWKAETEQKKILRRWLGQSQLTWGCNSIWCRCLHTNRHHALAQYLQMCASDPAVLSILIHS